MEDQQNILRLTLYEAVRINPTSIAALGRDDGAGPADAGVAETLEDLALYLAQLPAAYRDSRFRDLASACCEIGEIAGALGLERLSRVARTVAGLTAGDDSVALAANLARLMRLGNEALSVIWNLQDRIV
ncbi:hypothetical protein [Oceaniglobus indicus]|uniref:hypothetical protein n=1 Tax=Oceaniglobus indicus TaxID=2047749 RepID=UPI000C1A7418|nr:hypothetical protein [Oceaniglobus indicus]